MFTTLHKSLRTATAIAIASSAMHSASADGPISIYAGINVWQQDFDGYVTDLLATTPTQVDFQDDLGLSDDDGNVLFVALEHPIPFLPNVLLRQTTVEVDGTNTLARQIEYGDQVFNISTSVISEADLSHTDLTVYYEVLDNVVSLDLGLTARFFDGFVQVQDAAGTTTGREDFDTPVPLIYMKARADLPFTGGYVSLTGNALGDGDNTFVDFQGTVGWESGYGLGVEAGYRVLDLELDDLDDVDAELTIDGAFAGLAYHF